MTIRAITRLVFITGSALLFATSGALAQTIDGTIVGTVTDPSGAAVPKAKVSATSKATGVTYPAAANDVGEFRINHVPVGEYSVDAAASGFAKATVENVSVELNRTATVDLSLALASQATTIEVTQATAQIDSANSQLQVNFDRRAIEDVPATAWGSGFLNMSLLAPNVSSPGGLGIGFGPSVGGQRPTNNRFFVEGADNNNYFAPGPNAYVSNEVISEFTLLQNNFAPEFGGASGGIFNAILKTGGNQLHGSLYEYMQNRLLTADDAIYAREGFSSTPRHDSNRLGFTIGGPILKNRLFYFGAFEYNPAGFASAPGNVVAAPTATGYQMLGQIAGISQTNLQVFEKYVPPASVANAGTTPLNGINIPLGTIFPTAPAFQNNYRAVGALDWNASDQDQIHGRYILSKSDGIDTNTTFPSFYVPTPTTTQLGSATEDHAFSATLQNEFRAAYSRFYSLVNAPNQIFPGLDAFPTLQFYDLGGLTLGADLNVPQGTIQGELQASDTLTKSIGRHTFTAGYEFRDIIMNSAAVSYPRGYYYYASLGEYLDDLSPSVIGQRTLGPNGSLSNGLPVGFLQNAVHLNDDFRIRHNLTLNVGIRYDYVTVPVTSRAQQYSAAFSVPGVIGFTEPQPEKNDWAPRMGFAYSPGASGAWVIRGAFSRAFDMPFANIATNTLPAYYGAVANAPAGIPNFLGSGGISGSYTPSITTYTPDQKLPYAISYTLGVQRSLGKDYTIEARYLGTKGVHLLVQEQINRDPIVTSSFYIPTFTTLPSTAVLQSLPYTFSQLYQSYRAGQDNPFRQYSALQNAITAYEPIGNSRYNGLSLQLNKRYSKGFSYTASYTWSHAMDDSTATVNTTLLTPRRPQDPSNLDPEWANSMLDRRQRFTFSPAYDFTPFQNRSWLLKNIAGNWMFVLTYTYESPEYATVQSNLDSNLNGDTVGDRAIVNVNGIPGTATGVTGYDRNGNPVNVTSMATAANVVAWVANKPNAQYVQAAWGALANSGRNTLPLQPIDNIDFSIRKVLPFSESKRFEIGAEFYNLLNHPQFTGGYSNDVSAFRSPSNATINFLVPSNPQFGQYWQYLPSNSRVIQVMARITF